jgi:1A family penicillin-binding protein
MKKQIIRYLKWVAFTIILFLGIGIGLLFYYSHELPPLSLLQRYEMKVGSEVYDIHDNLIHRFSFEKRQLTNVNDLPPYFIDGLIAVEDKTFYDHWGMDLSGFFRALFVNLKRASLSQGASTITQQLARNMFLSLDKQIPRKIKELLLAIRIEQNYSKQEILEMYLNKSPFGPGLYGIEIASLKYFNKRPSQLNIPEAALLIGMPQLPSAYYPYRYPERALQRRNIVLKRMLEENVISDLEYNYALQDSIILTPPTGNEGSADYFTEYIRPVLESKYGTTRLFTGGLKIYTTLDYELQTYADSILNLNLKKFEEKNDYDFKYADFPVDTINIITPYIQGGVFAIDPETGYVPVMVGGRNFNHSKFNRIMQSKRQPGSSFKPVLYTTALANGYTAATIIKDEPVIFIYSDTLFYKSKNYSRKNFGYTRLRNALKKSRNVCAVKVITDIGPRKVVEYARLFGITTRLYPITTLAVGSMEVLPYELISGYTAFPNLGERVKPIFIRRVEDSNGNVIESAVTERIRVVDEETAYIMVSMMQSVIESGTGVGVRWQSGGYRWTAAGKTGTTDDFRDAWFIGYNKKLVVGIWVGFDDNSSLGKNQSGAVAALPTWPAIMRKAVYLDSPLNSSGNPIVDGSRYKFDRPDGIIEVDISSETGLLPRSSYEEVVKEVFISGTEPNPLSDSLEYNFYPTMYRINETDSLVIDLGGRRYVFPDSIEYEEVVPDTSKPDSTIMQPVHVPTGIDLTNVQIIKNRKIVTRPDSLLINKPFWLLEADSLSTLDSLDNNVEYLDLLLEAE